MTDKILPLGDNKSSLRFKDMGDGTVAKVLAAAVSSAPAAGDKLAFIGVGTAAVRLRDMGDGTHAVVVFGK